MYDNNGNILKQRKFSFTLKENTLLEEQEALEEKEYYYNGDQLMYVNTEAFVYDTIDTTTLKSVGLLQ